MARRKVARETIDEKNLQKGIDILNKHNQQVAKERKQRLNIEDDKKEEEREDISSARKVFRVFFVIIIVVGLVVFFNYGPILGIKLFDIDSDDIVINNILSNETICLEYNSELLIYSSGIINTYDKSGNITWTYKLIDGFVPTIYTNGKYMLVANKNNGMIYYFDSKKEIANRVIEGNIENVYINSTGTFIVQYVKDVGYKKIIAMYDKKGKQKYSEEYIDSSPIIGIEFTQEENKVLVVQADSSHITIGTVFGILNFSDSSFQKIITLEDKLIYNYKFLNDEIIYISDKAVESYNINNGNKAVVHSLEESQTNYVSLSSNYFVTVETINSGSKVSSKKFDDTDIASNVLNTYPKYIENSGLLTYIASENTIYIINKWGVIVSEIGISLSPKKIVVFNEEKSAALIYSNKVQIINI
ncbi:MAG: hypothetical protein IJ809_04560 [Clostridia bacterium]|nr:hypothetical protein [Clostridia bacterium]